MFDALDKYKNNDHFFLKKGKKIADQLAGVPDLPGVFLIYRLARDKVQLAYIGHSVLFETEEGLQSAVLPAALSYRIEGGAWQEFLDETMEADDIEALDIYWYVTMDNKEYDDLPGFVGANVMQRYFEVNGDLPPWNNYF